MKAVVLFNMGGPDGNKSVRRYLYNIFSDKNIIGLPAPLRQLLALLISVIRQKGAKKRYAHMGGKSPLLQNTINQAQELQAELSKHGNYKCFTAMRYWHPFIKDVCENIYAENPEEVILLPLYPQFSFATAGSAIEEFDKRFKGAAARKVISFFYANDGFIGYLAAAAKKEMDKADYLGSVSLVMVAHGLPEICVRRGDPYESQCEKTAKAVAEKLKISEKDWILCYQSRVGTKKWLSPYFDTVIENEAKSRKAIVVLSISFVSEHMETIVELKYEGKKAAKNYGAPHYSVVETAGLSSEFIKGLSAAVLNS